MIQVLIRLLTFNVMSEHPAVYWGLAAVWTVLLLTSVSSLRSLDIPARSKLLWFAFIFFIPLIGLGAYAVRCIVKSDWGFLRPFFVPSRTSQKVSPR